MVNLVSTYRIQFNKDFTFSNFANIISYLKGLGISTVYASPILEAVPGSAHGYDGLDPHNINPEIGSLNELKKISKALQQDGINWLQDIVPNHMGFHYQNKWLMDVLENGQESSYAKFFDIDWKEKLMIPFLGKPLDEAISEKELNIVSKDGKQYVQHYDTFYPLKTSSPINENASNDEFKNILDQQYYRLCSWKETDGKINYRRFFTINSLICLNIHHKEVFDEYHSFIRQLMDEGIFNGLRVDHIDGLYDPTKYLQRLRELAGEETYITLEKILQPKEDQPTYWSAEGNTGYDFLALVNNLFTQTKSEQSFTDFYQQLTNDFSSLEFQIQNKKAYILFNHMQGELNNLYTLFKESDIVNKSAFAAIRQDDLREAISEFLIHCPVYRFYGNSLPLSNEEAASVQYIFNKIKSLNSELSAAVGLLEQAILQNPHDGDEERNKRASHFYQRCMQFTGPLMAKGVEDTLMYTYNRFIAHNEVGDQPSSFGITVNDFHESMIQRSHHWAYSQNTTATHDTKRGEDARARLNVLTDIPEVWLKKVTEWRQLNAENKGLVDANDEYFIYQSLIGSYPFLVEEDSNFENRFNDYLQKAFREAKTHSNWTEPNADYESAVKEFVGKLLQKDTSFWRSFTDVLQQIQDHGIINSLSQLLLKFTCPGIPDVYQGCESWDFSFVDPDNRRPVNYQQREEWLKEITSNEPSFESLWDQRYSGKIKLWLTHKLFAFRKQQPELLAEGEYIPVEVNGKYKDNIIAFARKFRKTIYLIALPLDTATLCNGSDILNFDWKDTKIILPADVNAEWDDFFTEVEEKYTGEVSIKEAFANKPLLIWKGNQSAKERSAGILLHITSLSSPFGIGDMGTEAKAFADFLYNSKQKFWQLLPLNPTEGGQGHSPYSAISAMAGNTLLISPDELAKQGLIDKNELSKYHLVNEGKVSFAEVEKSKEEILNKAFWAFVKENNDRTDFESFCEKESFWLNDFAYFILIKQLNQGKPWFLWQHEYKLKDKAALLQLDKDYSDELYRTKWLQYIFFQQWVALKAYCNERNISLIGDLPIYVSYDSADVWSNREIFAIDDHGNATGIAGVPPDAFSADGQLWGMPVFKWDVLKERKYDWWLDRIKRNHELFDLVRIDHFRAFAAYWEVQAGDSTAKNGEWKPGPGSDFFTTIKNELGELPFIAEDLGDVDDTVFNLRDEFGMPGMKVLQFAFGNDLPHSVHIPHNHSINSIVYTGTHDNNTTRGWYKHANEETKHWLKEYVGKDVSEEEVHWILARMAYASVAKIAILPMQDILNLDETARMNTPASANDNWAWRLTPDQLTKEVENKIRQMVEMYNR